MKRKIGFYVVSLFFLMFIVFSVRAEALSVNVAVNYDASSGDVGDERVITFSFSSENSFAFSAELNATGGIRIDSVSGCQYGGGVLVANDDQKARTVEIHVTLTGEGDQSLSISNLKCGNLQDPSDHKTDSTVYSAYIHVRTAGEIADEEARIRAEEERRAAEEAARQASIEEENRKQAAIAASIEEKERAEREEKRCKSDNWNFFAKRI